MNTKILDRLTFGFEIEGYFKEGMDEKMGMAGNFKKDGSVRRVSVPFNRIQKTDVRLNSDLLACNSCKKSADGLKMIKPCGIVHKQLLEYLRSRNNNSSEYASKIFDSYDEMIGALRLFKTENYVFNDTCGLHLHIGTKEQDTGKIEELSSVEFNEVLGRHEKKIIKKIVKTQNWKKLYQTAQNWELHQMLVGEAKSYCECQNKRLTKLRNDGRDGDFFCKPYRDKRTLIQATRSQIKYSFMHFHSVYKTLEFRFFCPCEHKVQNVEKLVSSLTLFLGKDSKKSSFKMAETGDITNNSMIARGLGKAKEKLEIIKPLFTIENLPFYRIDRVGKKRLTGCKYTFTGSTLRGLRRELKDWEIKTLPKEFRNDVNGYGEIIERFDLRSGYGSYFPSPKTLARCRKEEQEIARESMRNIFDYSRPIGGTLGVTTARAGSASFVVR